MPRNTCSGVPVLLNFTGTENFFTCIKQGEERILSVTVSFHALTICMLTWKSFKLQLTTFLLSLFQMYDLNKLRCISADDTEKWSLVFFMTQCASGPFRFESALHSGWFISVDSNVMKLQRENPPNTFFYLIESEATKTIKHGNKFGRNVWILSFLIFVWTNEFSTDYILGKL